MTTKLTEEELAEWERLAAEWAKGSLKDSEDERWAAMWDYANGAHDIVPRLLAEVRELRTKLSRVESWTHEFGAALTPPGPDTYGEGMRDAKHQVARIVEYKDESDELSTRRSAARLEEKKLRRYDRE